MSHSRLAQTDKIHRVTGVEHCPFTTKTHICIVLFLETIHIYICVYI